MKDKKEYTMHFDIAIQNPPYDRNLHLKVLEQVLKVADKVINISPVRWLQDPFAPYLTRSDYCKFEDSISKKIESLDIIPAKDASQLFDASFSMNLGIYVCDKGGYEYQHNDPLITKIVEKTMANNWMPFSPKNYYNSNIEKKNFALNVAGFGDPIMCKTYASQLTAHLVSKDNAMHGGGSKRGGHFEFDTEEERKNFYDCYTHPFMLWHSKLWKVDQSTYDDKVPYFGDYTHQWRLRDFFDWFDLTPAERTRVIKEIRDMRHARFH